MGPRAVMAIVAALTLVACAAPADARTLAECGQQVIRDWYSGGRIDKVYPLPCYREAIRALPEDVLQYTDASHTIERALAEARRGRLDKPARPASAPSAPAQADQAPRPSPRTVSQTPRAAKAEQRSAQATPERAPARRTDGGARLASGPVPAGRDGGLPYPLIALAALAPVLLLSGLIGALARRRG